MTGKNNDAGSSGSRGIMIAIKSFLSFALTFAFMLGTWVVLSGKFDPLLLWLGGISSFIVSYYFFDLLFPSFEFRYAVTFFRFLAYALWLIIQIIKANFHMLKIVFHPRMNTLIDPHIITFKTHLTSDIAITTLANSITLTPGTITVTATSDGAFKVHSIDRQSAEGLPGTMLEKVAHVFGEDK